MTSARSYRMSQNPLTKSPALEERQVIELAIVLLVPLVACAGLPQLLAHEQC